jgi:hypothetical protein
MSGHPLPPGWTVIPFQGRMFYRNIQTGVSSLSSCLVAHKHITHHALVSSCGCDIVCATLCVQVHAFCGNQSVHALLAYQLAHCMPPQQPRLVSHAPCTAFGFLRTNSKGHLTPRRQSLTLNGWHLLLLQCSTRWLRRWRVLLRQPRH